MKKCDENQCLGCSLKHDSEDNPDSTQDHPEISDIRNRELMILAFVIIFMFMLIIAGMSVFERFSKERNPQVESPLTREIESYEK
jgi:hypothetical protein